jgi:MFS family permease
MVGQGLAALGGVLAGSLVTRLLDPAQVDAWGWRLPFLVGLVIGPVGLYIRRNLEETEAFQSLAARATAPVGLGVLLREHRRAVAAAFLLIVCGTTAYYVVLLYMPTYAKTQLALPLADALLAQMFALAWMVLLVPVFGALSDRIGRRRMLQAATIGYFALPYPLLAWTQSDPSFARLLATQLTLCSVVAAFFGPMSTALAEQFPTGVRSTGMGIAYNLAVMLFGGFAPFIITWLIGQTHLASAPALYIMFGAVVGFVATWLLRATPGAPDTIEPVASAGAAAAPRSTSGSASGSVNCHGCAAPARAADPPIL